MRAEFTNWLLDNSHCRNCDHYLRGLCGVSERIVEELRKTAPVLEFRPDGDAPATDCLTWFEPESDYRDRMWARYQGELLCASERDVENVRSARGFV